MTVFPFFPISMLALLLLGAFVLVPLIIVLVKKPKAGLIVLGCLGVVCGLAVFWLAVGRSSTSDRYSGPSVRIVQTPAGSVPPEDTLSARGNETPSAEGPEWSPPEDWTEADVYPSARAAAEALAGRVAEEANRAWQGAEPPTTITLVGPDWTRMFNGFQEALRGRWPQAKFVEKREGPASSGARESNELRVLLRFRGNGGDLWANPEVGDSGRAVLSVLGPAGTAGAEAPFVRKPWADNFSVYVADHSRENWIMASSPSPCASSNEAHRKALREAARRLEPAVRQELNRRGIAVPMAVENQGRSLPDRIEEQLGQGGLVNDRFLQRFRLRYGDVWKESLLIDSQPAKIAMLVQQMENQNRQLTAAERIVRTGWARTGASIAGLIVLTVLVYLLLNAATKGYYAGRLRAVVAIVALAVVLLLLVCA